MSNLISEEYRKANKEHTCYLCSGKIKKGEEYLRSFLQDGGDVWSICEHRKCYDLVADLDAAYLMDGGEYTDTDFEDAVNELCRKEICPNCPLFDKEAKECSEDKWIVDECMENVWDFAKTHIYAPNVGKWVLKAEGTDENA